MGRDKVQEIVGVPGGGYIDLLAHYRSCGVDNRDLNIVSILVG